MEEITWEDFERVELLAGTVISAEPFPKAHCVSAPLLLRVGAVRQLKGRRQPVLPEHPQQQL